MLKIQGNQQQFRIGRDTPFIQIARKQMIQSARVRAVILSKRRRKYRKTRKNQKGSVFRFFISPPAWVSQSMRRLLDVLKCVPNRLPHCHFFIPCRWATVMSVSGNVLYDANAPFVQTAYDVCRRCARIHFNRWPPLHEMCHS